MHLLHTTSYKLEEFVDDEIPPYAILSHTWGKEEITFQDITAEVAPTHKIGWPKIAGACQHASEQHHQYIWVDTCCINKSSSAELSEAINSMYRYYEKAEICFVHLADVHVEHDLVSLKDLPFSFTSSRWFTRGWTLQELIAPRNIVFYSSTWKVLGEKRNLAQAISYTTNIEIDLLLGGQQLQAFSTAQRMSWASKRTTTRREDEAYCLMGLFAVNMPLLYGEGTRAFYRLQQEIIKESSDQSIFAWRESDPPKSADKPGHFGRGLLASSPADFEACGEVVSSKIPLLKSYPYTMTNQGLQITLRLMCAYWDSMHLAYLDCTDKSRENSVICILLHRFDVYGDQFCRVRASEVFHFSHPRDARRNYTTQHMPMYIREPSSMRDFARSRNLVLSPGGTIRIVEDLANGIMLHNAKPSIVMQSRGYAGDMCVTPEHTGTVAALLYRHALHASAPGFILVIAMDELNRVSCNLQLEEARMLYQAHFFPPWPLSYCLGRQCSHTFFIDPARSMRVNALVTWRPMSLRPEANPRSKSLTQRFGTHVPGHQEETQGGKELYDATLNEVFVCIGAQTYESSDVP